MQVTVKLDNNQIVLEELPGFSIDMNDPKIVVGQLYSALFSKIEKPTLIALSADVSVLNDNKAKSYFDSLKKVVDEACALMNPELSKILAASAASADETEDEPEGAAR